ncbi:MAG: GntR family transcriptional regulator [Lachnospiraceae bacterium]|nr:GntR family transcriptional regulator [Lachnospiraceae bacterium]
MQDYHLVLQTDDFLPLRDVVFNTLRQGILRGELKPGERLMEIHLADQLGVSRTPIREAIRMLELEGLVIMMPRKGAMVASISKEDLKDVLEVRKALDRLAVSLACERITPDGLASLKVAATNFKDVTKTLDSTKIAEADVAFHDEIHKASGNKRLSVMVSNLAERIYRYRFEYIKESYDCVQLIEEHDEIVKCIEKGDKEGAVAAIDRHIDNQESSIIKQLEL